MTLYILWRETDTRIDSLMKQVREGVAVDEASNFARWVRFSGVVQILSNADFSNSQLVADVSGLKLKLQDLVWECGEWYRKHERSNTPRDAYVSASKLEALEKQMRQMSEQLARLAPPMPDSVPQLTILAGGAK